MPSRWFDLASALGLLVLVVAGFYLTSQIDLSFSSELESFTGPRAYPRILLSIMAVLSLTLMVRAWADWRRAAKSNLAGTTEAPGTRNNKGVILAVAVLTGFLFLFEPLGYLLTIVPLVMAVAALNGAPNLGRNFLYAAVSTLIYLAIFRYGLNTVLPEGLLGIDQIF